MFKFNGKLTSNNEFKHDIKKYTLKNNLLNKEKLQLLSTHEKKFISNDDKENLWADAYISDSFDENIFRLDILGNLIVKNMSYNNSNNEQKKFAYELEQVKNSQDTCFINTGILSILDIHLKCQLDSLKLLHNVNLLREHIIYEYIIQEHHLLYDLENDLHNTCIKYNLLFGKNINDKWTILKSLDTLSLYKIYSNEYNKITTPLIINNNNKNSIFNNITNIASNLYNNNLVGNLLKIVAVTGIVFLLQDNTDDDDD